MKDLLATIKALPTTQQHELLRALHDHLYHPVYPGAPEEPLNAPPLPPLGGFSLPAAA